MRAMPQIEIPVVNTWGGGIYARQITIKKGTALTGAIHLTEHMNIIASGDIEVMTDHGMERIVGPRVLVSKPGTKRAGYAHEDTVWITLHATAEKDLDKLKAELIAEGEDDPRLALIKESLWLG